MSQYGAVVTVYCMTYNHESYIEKTLEGFVSQQTNFRFKVIVHDDASTDGTAEIVRKYAEKYPDIIFPIFQTENKYSQHISIFDNFIKPELEGRYIAVCEGDDYWCDMQKLQMQYDYMEQHPECALCVHNTKRIDADGKELHKLFNESLIDVDYTTDEIIVAGGGGLFHTSSFFMRTKSRFAFPDEFKISGIGDYPLSIWLSVDGKYVHYIGKVMSAYRMKVPGSWTSRNANTYDKKIAFRKDSIDAIKRMDDYTGGKYHKSFEKRLKVLDYQIFVINRKYVRILVNPKYWKLFLSSIFRRLCRFFNRKNG